MHHIKFSNQVSLECLENIWICLTPFKFHFLNLIPISDLLTISLMFSDHSEDYYNSMRLTRSVNSSAYIGHIKFSLDTIWFSLTFPIPIRKFGGYYLQVLETVHSILVMKLGLLIFSFGSFVLGQFCVCSLSLWLWEFWRLLGSIGEIAFVLYSDCSVRYPLLFDKFLFLFNSVDDHFW